VSSEVRVDQAHLKLSNLTGETVKATALKGKIANITKIKPIIKNFFILTILTIIFRLVFCSACLVGPALLMKRAGSFGV